MFSLTDMAPARHGPSRTRRGEGRRRIRTCRVVRVDGGGWRSLWEGEIAFVGEERR